jgi:hypothetical protein
MILNEHEVIARTAITRGLELMMKSSSPSHMTPSLPHHLIQTHQRVLPDMGHQGRGRTTLHQRIYGRKNKMSDIKVGDLAKVEDTAYEVKYVTNPKRVLIDMGMGTLVALDYKNGAWDFSGDPTNAAETAFIESQPDFGKTEVVITKDKP